LSELAVDNALRFAHGYIEQVRCAVARHSADEPSQLAAQQARRIALKQLARAEEIDNGELDDQAAAHSVRMIRAAAKNVDGAYTHEVALRGVRALLAQCPIQYLEGLADRTGRADLGHRCRLAYDSLLAFARRNDPHHDRATRTAGHAYAGGRLSLSEVCAVPDVTPSDAVAFLERTRIRAATWRDRPHRRGP
jgi:hypothetical protein